jgi:protein-S-isoprenylcysteine O-methyltransferase Ste14
MRPLVFTWPYWLLFWAVYFIVFFPEMRLVMRSRRQAVGNAQDAGSLRVINLGMQLGSLAAFVTAFYFPSLAIRWHRVAFFYAGVALLILGSLLRRHCWRILGQHFTGAVVVTENQPVIDRGAYRFVRHPAYTGGILMFIGIGLALGHWLSIAVLLATSIAVYAYRVTVEERALVATLGAPYADYMRRTKRFIPCVI